MKVPITAVDQVAQQIQIQKPYISKQRSNLSFKKPQLTTNMFQYSLKRANLMSLLKDLYNLVKNYFFGYCKE